MKIRSINIVKNRLLLTIVLIVLFVLLTYKGLAFYVRFEFDFLLFLLVLPFVIKQESNSRSMRFGILAIILSLLFPFLKLSSIYFLAFICTLFFIYEYQYGKLSIIPIVLVIIVLPIAIFISEVVGFEIRLSLTKVAAKILQYINSDYNYSGNIILIGEREFHVDSECMGLKMVLLSMFISLLFITYNQQKKKGRIGFLFILFSLIISYVLVVISNLARIIIITLFQSPPNTFTHELIGIICFIVYFVIPIWFIVNRIPVRLVKKTEKNLVRTNKLVFFSFVIILMFLFSLYRFTNIGTKNYVKPYIYAVNYFSEGFSSSLEEQLVLKLANKDCLIYIKPAVNFYSADHLPIICWKGSGYKVIKEQIISTLYINVYFCELKRDSEILYSTWWYDNGKDKTISQFTWRFNNLAKGSNYRLINVISDNKDNLMLKTNEMLSKNIFEDAKK